MQVGDLVEISSAVADPKKYGVGFVEKIVPQSTLPSDSIVYVRWSVFPERSSRCARFTLRAISESR